MTTLVTFCGMVGSGKTINSKKTLRWLRQAGFEPYYIRFRHLGWRSLLRTPARDPWQDREKRDKPDDGRRSSSRKPPRRLETGKVLTLPLTLGYLARALQLRLFIFLHHRRHLVVMNRYLYDSFAHYRLTTPRELRYLRWLLAVVPRPTIPFLLVLRPETAHRRKPFYRLEELRQCAENIAHWQRLAPALRIVHTDNVSAVDDHVEQHLNEAFPQRRKREHVQESHS